jgi:hypothetical protein
MLIVLYRLSRRLALQHVSCLVIAMGTIIVHICLLRVSLFPTGQGHEGMIASNDNGISSVFRFSIKKDGAKFVRRDIVFEMAENSVDNSVYKLMDKDGEGGRKDTAAGRDVKPASAYAAASQQLPAYPSSSSFTNGTLLPNASSSLSSPQAAPAAAIAVQDSNKQQLQSSTVPKQSVAAVSRDIKPLLPSPSAVKVAVKQAIAPKLPSNASPAAQQPASLSTGNKLNSSLTVKASPAAAAVVSKATSVKKPGVIAPQPKPTMSPRIRINRRGSWQCQSLATKKQPNDELCVYSAIYDARKEAGGKPTIRIAAVSTIKQEDLPSIIWCQFLAVDASRNVRMTPVGNLSNVQITRVGRGHRVQTKPSTVPSSKQVNMLYAQIMISCLLPASSSISASSITHVSLVTNISQPTTNLLQIYRQDPVLGSNPLVKAPTNASAAATDPTIYEHEFGICVPISFGYIDPIRLINWVEMNKVLGVTEINIYNASMTSDADAVFSYYRGLIVVHQIVPPVPDRTYGGVKLGSPAGLNDCMYRNMHRYRYLIIIDFDEVITPRPDVNYASLMTLIDRSRQTTNRLVHSYSAKNAYFYLSYPPDMTYPPWQPYQRYRTRFDSKAVSVFDKSFLNPRLCLSAFNHYCYITLPDTTRQSIPTLLATVHHYTGCKKKCELMNSSAVVDDVMLRYGSYVGKTVASLAEQLNLKLPTEASPLSTVVSTP